MCPAQASAEGTVVDVKPLPFWILKAQIGMMFDV